MRIKSNNFLQRMIGKSVRPDLGITVALGIESLVQPDEIGVVIDVRWGSDHGGTFPIITVSHENATVEYCDFEIVRA